MTCLNLYFYLNTVHVILMYLYLFRLRDHVQGADNPLLIFPEGTCVNNHYTVMFKKVIVFPFKCPVF